MLIYNFLLKIKYHTNVNTALKYQYIILKKYNNLINPLANKYLSNQNNVNIHIGNRYYQNKIKYKNN